MQAHRSAVLSSFPYVKRRETLGLRIHGRVQVLQAKALAFSRQGQPLACMDHISQVVCRLAEGAEGSPQAASSLHLLMLCRVSWASLCPMVQPAPLACCLLSLLSPPPPLPSIFPISPLLNLILLLVYLAF